MKGVRHRRNIICAAMAVILIAGLLYRVARWNGNDTLTIQEPKETLEESSELSWNEAAQELEEPATVAVHVSGAVAHPDRVYFLAVGARIQEAIEIAGGATEDADLAQLNLAQKIADGQKIYVPRQGEEWRQVPTDAEKIGENQQKPLTNINLASKIELDALPGIGAAYAQNILDYREEHGGFKSVGEIMKVKGIGESTFEKIKDYITVE